jgi:hypothetical protein
MYNDEPRKIVYERVFISNGVVIFHTLMSLLKKVKPQPHTKRGAYIRQKLVH